MVGTVEHTTIRVDDLLGSLLYDIEKRWDDVEIVETSFGFRVYIDDLTPSTVNMFRDHLRDDQIRLGFDDQGQTELYRTYPRLYIDLILG